MSLDSGQWQAERGMSPWRSRELGPDAFSLRVLRTSNPLLNLLTMRPVISIDTI